MQAIYEWGETSDIAAATQTEMVAPDLLARLPADCVMAIIDYLPVHVTYTLGRSGVGLVAELARARRPHMLTLLGYCERSWKEADLPGLRRHMRYERIVLYDSEHDATFRPVETLVILSLSNSFIVITQRGAEFFYNDFGNYECGEYSLSPFLLSRDHWCRLPANRLPTAVQVGQKNLCREWLSVANRLTSWNSAIGDIPSRAIELSREARDGMTSDDPDPETIALVRMPAYRTQDESVEHIMVNIPFPTTGVDVIMLDE